MFSIAVLRNWGENVTSDDDSLGVRTGVAFLGPAPVSSFVKNLHAVLTVAAPVPTPPGIAVCALHVRGPRGPARARAQLTGQLCPSRVMNAAGHVPCGPVYASSGKSRFIHIHKCLYSCIFNRAAIVVYMSMPVSKFLPPRSIPPWYPHTCSPPVSISGWK